MSLDALIGNWTQNCLRVAVRATEIIFVVSWAICIPEYGANSKEPCNLFLLINKLKEIPKGAPVEGANQV